MVRRIDKQTILDRFRNKISKNESLLMFGAGTGLTARCAEEGGADIIGVYSTAIFRMKGLPSLLAWLPYSNANDHLINMAKEILPVIKETPCIAGVGAHDLTLDFDTFIDELAGMGFSGINNEPFCSLYGEFFKAQLDDAGLGFNREVELIKKANEKNMLTVAWVMTAEESEQMANAGADIIGTMIGVTAGGNIGAKKVMSMDESVDKVIEMMEAAKKVNADTIFLTHGGPFKDIETARESIVRTGAHGYASGSSGERIPTEQAILNIVKGYKEIKLK